ncbi:uncharacterized protein LOC110833502 isoform X2 [Zootermopsis nevadensis]|uniref:Uncharacterized protein n=1 Tax=Zootermopsis nevadensis TaxID=136037 RepID=A0A067QYL9_ZOONE|nr:uncharacterized protein LOC110833502 isoform X2 [Zootermopsis nevadensis]KDR15581.1 hypothetical protein L798_10526 [Zootermopsis nevadensis]
MAFGKSSAPRFQQILSRAPSPTRYSPQNDGKVKGFVQYDKQTSARFHSGHCHTQGKVKGFVQYDKQISAQFHSGQCHTQGKVGGMSKANGTYCLESNKESSGKQRELRTRDTTSSLRKTSRSRNHGNESKYKKQEAQPSTELRALETLLKSAEDYMDEAEDEAELMEKDVKAVDIITIL